MMRQFFGVHNIRILDFDENEVPLLVFFDDFGLEVNLIRY